jgi:hypothetical protein
MNPFKSSIFAVALVTASSCGQAVNLPQSTNAPNALTNGSRPSSTVAAGKSVLYVGNYSTGGSNVLVFTDSGKTLKRTVVLPNPVVYGVTADAAGNLFAASGNDFAKPEFIGVYKNEGAKLVKQLEQARPAVAMTLDPSGNLFASCGRAATSVCEYGASKRIVGRLIRRIKLEMYGVTAQLLSTDASGDLAVSDQNHVSVFAPGSTSPYLDITLTLRQIGTGGVTFDASGNLYIAWAGYYDTAGIAEYAPGSSKPTRNFYIPGNGQEAASVLKFDGSGNLYALFPACNLCGHQPFIEEFAPNGTKPIRTITKGIEDFTGYLTMAVDASGQIFLGNDPGVSKPGSIAVFPPNRSQPNRIITNGIKNPLSLTLVP